MIYLLSSVMAEPRFSILPQPVPPLPTTHSRRRDLQIQPRWSIRYSTLVILSLCCSLVVCGQEKLPGFAKTPAAEAIVLPKSVPDPLEPFNRVMWGFNKAVMTGVIKPSSRVYRIVIVKPIRTGIGNFGRNLTYPGRLINNLLQGKWNGARDESYRFACNTTVGVAGFFDVSTKWQIPKSDADFG